ncbi:Cytochrome c oxidase assembly factor 1 protein [Dioscorea alata]|uniref:Cytochrome c oxidase assembly factor 1 protein n=1 Tax=Dioscorea alata TaxID=55571 RepID=A0ACB7V7V8_DIOAL|nr:Cytochrome c oxidase assembly factor 1 protein [Dioscorea alata]
MLARRLKSLFHSSSRLRDRPLSPHFLSWLSTSSEQAGRKSSFRRKAVPIMLISLTGGVALSALNDLAIFHGCSSKAIERASQNQKVVEILGEPIARGPWYDASLAVGHRRHSVSCTFPVTGPLGSGSFQLKAIRNGEDTWFSFLRHHDWDILLLEALIHHRPSNDDKDQTLRITIADQMPSPPQN